MKFRIEPNRDRLLFWPLDDRDQAEPERYAKYLRSWGFSPEHHGPRPATEDEIASIAYMSKPMSEWLRENGIVWYEWPVVVQRAKEDTAGPGFDDLRDELAERGNKISFEELSRVLQLVRFRHLPPGRTGRSYTC